MNSNPCITCPQSHIKVLLSADTSRLNKIHLAIGWAYFRGWYIEWKWQGAPLRSRLLFRFHPEDIFVAAKSFDEDVLPTFNDGKSVPVART